ncbi:DUF1214 domain-containing protein [Tropicimonas sp. IMCC6043]|uniref:DUF1214 domain-containing protein n=1 Tax=Tropicimonas sp. IMCC6043 TaxID=2510645 RepID=UPI00101CE28D|nr:DUF1214 domain-containing protein [Tropicimonas sp. IMCC6043]RYH07178.1 DUF1254 domain-containing protein [Tropicimonas sp. IMCC6043]
MRISANLKSFGVVATVLSFTLVPAASAGTVQNQFDEIIAGREIPVTVDNFVRAVTDREFAKYLDFIGGVNTMFHIREPTPIDQQPTIRMNRDTLYSTAVVDISEGATLIIPDTGDRYISAQVVNQDHFMNEVFVGGGTYTLDMETFETPYVAILFRTLVDSSDPDDVAAVNALQDQIMIEAASAKPFILPNYDDESFEAVFAAALELSRHMGDSSRTFGRKGEVDPVRYFLGSAFGWGGLPEEQAYYLNVDPSLPVGEYKIEVPADVPVDAFWSVSLYNAEGRYEKNDLGVYNINSVTGIRNDDGSMTVNLGGCEDGRVNCIPIMEGWNYAVRLYQPRPEILDGSWDFPTAEPAN